VNNVWEEIKERLDIVDIISEYLPDIKPAGANYTALSPFKKEKTPSFMVSPSKQIFHCFSTGTGGDIFKFVQLMEGLSKAEVLKKLAKKAKIELPKLNNKQEKKEKSVVKNERLLGYEYLEWTATVYNKMLLKILQDRNNPITQYCIKRNLTIDIIKQFKIGYVPKNNFIKRLAEKYKLNLKLLYKIGILKQFPQPKNETEYDTVKMRDKFSDRLTIPIMDKQGRVCGFTSRILPYETADRPKYLNSPQSDWFDKSKTWFGWDLSRMGIIQRKKAIVVEGNMDVIAAFVNNLPFTVASQGTAFSKNQLKILKQITRVVWLAFDNDSAGKAASKKFFKIATSIGMEVRKVLIPDEHKDLDDYLSSMTGDITDETLKTKPFLEYFLLDNKAELCSKDLGVQKKAILETLDLFNVLDALDMERYLKKLANLSDVSFNILESLATKSKQGYAREQKILQRHENKEPGEKNNYSSKYDNIIINWQKLCATQLFAENPILDIEILSKYYTLIKELTGDRLKNTNITEYVSENQENLEFIYSTIDNSDKEYPKILQQITIRFIDQNMHNLLNAKNYETYLEIKKHS